MDLTVVGRKRFLVLAADQNRLLDIVCHKLDGCGHRVCSLCVRIAADYEQQRCRKNHGKDRQNGAMNHSVAVSVAFKTVGSGKQTKGPGRTDLVIRNSGVRKGGR